MVGRLLSFWDGVFSEAMLNFQGVTISVSMISSTHAGDLASIYAEKHLGRRKTRKKRVTILKVQNINEYTHIIYI